MLQRIPLANCGRAYDLGCGTGHVTYLLSDRWPSAKVTGIDDSPEMLAHARSEFPDLDWVEADIAAWRAPAPADLIFSNAALQWVPNHSSVLPDLLQQVRAGGVLAVQMPHHVAVSYTHLDVYKRQVQNLALIFAIRARSNRAEASRVT